MVTNCGAITRLRRKQAGVFIDPIDDPYFASHRILQFNEASE